MAAKFNLVYEQVTQVGTFSVNAQTVRINDLTSDEISRYNEAIIADKSIIAASYCEASESEEIKHTIIKAGSYSAVTIGFAAFQPLAIQPNGYSFH